MEMIQINSTELVSSKIGLGTWAIGGWLWGGTDEKESIQTIEHAVELGINLIDTAPVYGFGLSEEIVGKALKGSNIRDRVLIATKCGLEWNQGNVRRNSSKDRIIKEIEDSLRRLATDRIDIYQIHWPDESTPFEESAAVLEKLYRDGKIRAVGVSNFSPTQMKAFQTKCPLHTNQPPYNIFERDIEKDILLHTEGENVVTLAYGALCRGLLSGRMNAQTEFTGDDIRKVDPKFQKGRFEQYLDAVKSLDEFAQARFNKRVIHIAIRWLLDQNISVIALWGARRPEQLDVIKELSGWSLSAEDIEEMNRIVMTTVKDPVGPDFMGPPRNLPAK